MYFACVACGACSTPTSDYRLLDTSACVGFQLAAVLYIVLRGLCFHTKGLSLDIDPVNLVFLAAGVVFVAGMYLF
ncbi:hypothetical protein [Paraburkholderia adhaesiva]|uniref:hypothetical protein n=1 Tax=Paraburkholderia adhaesiva TaxID=2883244 RepID=UPI001F2C6DC0|nr:hypothetical protein [Paraburkholderia adhaesiva]